MSFVFAEERHGQGGLSVFMGWNYFLLRSSLTTRPAEKLRFGRGARKKQKERAGYRCLPARDSRFRRPDKEDHERDHEGELATASPSDGGQEGENARGGT